MRRATFLKRVGLALGGVVLGRHIPLEAVPVAEAAPVQMNLVTARATQLTSFGGLCAPVTPFYDIPAYAAPIRQALPTFTASRGGVALPE